MQDKNLDTNQAKDTGKGFLQYLKKLLGNLNTLQEELKLNPRADKLPEAGFKKLEELETIIIKDNYQLVAAIIKYQLPKVLQELIETNKIQDIQKEALQLIYNILTKKYSEVGKTPEIKLGPQESGALLTILKTDEPGLPLPQLLSVMDISARDKEGSTLMHYAAYTGLVEEMQILLENKCPVDAKNNAGATPLHYAAITGNLDVIKLLLNAGANFEEKLGDKTPLILAQERNYSEAAKLLSPDQEERKIHEESSLDLTEIIEPQAGENINDKRSVIPKHTYSSN